MGFKQFRQDIELLRRIGMAEGLNSGYRYEDFNERQICGAGHAGISEKYLEQIIAVLNKAGYVKSVRGAQGGYKIARAPEEYTVGMILRLTEGSMAPVACLDEGAEECERCDTCETLQVWKDLYAAINQVIDNVTIADLVERRRKREGNLDYSI